MMEIRGFNLTEVKRFFGKIKRYDRTLEEYVLPEEG